MKQHRNEQRRAITINNNLWAMAAEKSEIDGIKSMSTVIRLLLQAYVDGKVEIVARPVKRENIMG